jgi:RHS repeat-associated protein
MPQDQRYTAQTSDATANASGGSGLLYYNARYYDPTTAQFTQPDTIVPEPTDSAGWNRYAYVSGNPIRFADPTGHVEIDCVIPWDDPDNGCAGGSIVPEPIEDIAGLVADVVIEIPTEFYEYLLRQWIRRALDPAQTVKDIVSLTVFAEDWGAAYGIASGGRLESSECPSSAVCIAGVPWLGAPNAVDIGHTILFRADDITQGLARHEEQHLRDLEDLGGLPYILRYWLNPDQFESRGIAAQQDDRFASRLTVTGQIAQAVGAAVVNVGGLIAGVP